MIPNITKAGMIASHEMWRRSLVSVIAIRLCRLTPELSRTAARNGGVVHVTMQPTVTRVARGW
ncbi:hypothetical protein GCM10010080_30920 [Thermomonas carbonis]|nr:hypothetical protein GCM10010080_30920 [Thermomonas carbonis]